SARGREDDAGGSGRLEHAHGADDVHLSVVGRLGDGGGDVGLRGQVDADVGTDLPEELAQQCVADVELFEARRVRDVLALSGRQVVDDDDLVATGDKRVHDVRADEARAPGDERPHGNILGNRMFVTFEGLDGSGKSTQA